MHQPSVGPPKARFHFLSSLRTRLLAVFLAILCPILLLQLYIYSWSTESISRELTTAAATNVTYLKNQFVDNIQSITLQMEYLLVSKEVNTFFVHGAALSDSAYYLQISDIMGRMLDIRYGNPTLYAIRVYFPMLKREIVVSDARNRTSLPSSLITVEGSSTYLMTDGEIEELTQRYQRQKTLLSKKDGELYLLYGRQSATGGTPQYITQAVLNQEKLADQLGSFDMYNDKKAFLIHPDSGTVLASRTELTDIGGYLCENLARTQDEEVHSQQICFDNQHYLAFYISSNPMRVTFVQLIDDASLNAIPLRLRKLITIISLMAALGMGFYGLSMQRLVNRPVRDLVDGFRIAGQGKLNQRLKSDYSDEFNQLSSGYNAMTTQLEQLFQKNYEQTILLQQATLKQMQSQIQPHFLYNSFFMLRHAIRNEDSERAEKICDYLGHYFQYITQQDRDFLPLKQEYDHMLTYVAIQTMRFQPRLRTEIELLSTGMAELMVPRLVLQPILENAMEYGIPSAEALVRVHFQLVAGVLTINVEDSGTELEEKAIEALNERLGQTLPLSGSHALENIHRRLVLLYGRDCGLRFTRSELGGLNVEMRLKPGTETLPIRGEAR
ncbi:MAG: histidine kinase [Eubacteriales bacterium]|nr:histidine kinase [Eubacteriales bacterium]